MTFQTVLWWIELLRRERLLISRCLGLGMWSRLAKKIRKIHQVSTKIVQLVVGCLGVVSGQLEGF